ncbi:MAG: amino acid permease, partial [Candidatus Thorarchaeota archaeon]
MNIFTLVMINVAAMISLSSLPEVAGYGLSSIIYYLFAVTVFLIPVSLVSAELATGWPKHGGVYIWVKEALGSHWGFLAIWLQWIQIVFFYPTILSFAATSLVFWIDPTLQENRLYVFFFIVLFFWCATFLNFNGMKLSSRISTVGVIIGTIIPGALLIFLAILSLLLGNVSQTPLTFNSLLPDVSNINNIVFAIGIFLTFAGMEMSATHAEEVKNPQKNYPKAILYTVIIVLIIMTTATVAISIVVPKSKISLVAGLMQAFNVFLETFNLQWIIPFISIC